MKRKRLGDLLVENGIITGEQLAEALNYQKQNGKRLGDALVQLGLLTYEQLIEVLEFQLGIPHINLYKFHLDEKTINLISSDTAKRFSVVPLKLQNGRLTLAMADPLDVVAIDEISRTTGYEIEPVIATPDEIQRVLDHHYGIKESVDKVIKNLEENKDIEKEMEAIEKLKEMVDDAPIVRVVNSIIEQAIRDGASDIHIEPAKDKLVIRFRIDGILHDIMKSPKHTHPVIVSRLKIMANMDIAERRLPQDNRFQTMISGREVDVRVSTLPTIYGEKMVLRILDTSSLILDINKLGMEQENFQRFKEIISKPNGIFLVTGPTGCGKTTTLYSLLSYFNSREKNIVTIEDPVEYRLEGINQVNVMPKIGLNFAEGLRSILRQDPDIVMVGEIRDKETAEIAIRAALTGHMVLSTLHTNDAPSALNRLVDMGLPPFLVASAINGVMAQRLVRKICSSCNGIGCGQCNNTGYKGRAAIHEVLVLDDEIRKGLMAGWSSKQLKDMAIKKGMRTLYQDGLAKVKQGVTTEEEVLKVAYGEEF
ncbi:type IV pilus assembly protein PilB [Anaerobranca californiensis DSM 14826]|jgi:type IV pilus assembly protein PilB|uniref:Type IV pilus assembly protein PilB n=1 Tax=Anaerobranca californiensis DSM 14826 TaxID=1120989 RepID=A0A1M6LBM8_9FIRM|nr:ATPase, T2SS/T4P/T4SS family [Anaerobranca californiensis]SHJ68569.1 type IV pilus assembly protein PilB [Anaerobranca californiensis DSM 14826]